jgi:DMSO/TMAO reductase YedYZ molybdopterin-dependent catalytic subunit
MVRKGGVSRRGFFARAVQVSSLLALAGCDNVSRSEWFATLTGKTEGLTKRAQRAVTARRALAREYAEADRSAKFPANGNTEVADPGYQALAAAGFADWKLEVGGLVRQPTAYSLEALQAMPARTQITRHDCVEGWSAIGKWKGVPLRDVLAHVEPRPEARFVVFHCADTDDEAVPYYESIDFDEAYHPQTILAYEMNDEPLPVPHGAPIRLRVERQLGYKQAKYIMRIQLVESFDEIAGGNGGYWEDQGYEWYAGV